MGHLKTLPYIVYESEVARMQRRESVTACLAAAVSALLTASVLLMFSRRE